MTDYLNSDGLKIKTLNELREDILVSLKTSLGPEIDTSENSVIGQITDIFAASQYEVWELLQGLHSSLDIRSAEGTQLENLVILGGLIRKEATSTTGYVQFSGSANTYVPDSTLVSSLKGATFLTVAGIRLTPGTCYELILEPDGDNYLEGVTGSIQIDGDVFTVTRGVGQSLASVTSDFVLAINNSFGNYSAQSLGAALEIINDADESNLTINLSNDFIVDSITTTVQVAATETGLVYGSANTVNNLPTGINGIDSVTNRDSFAVGSDAEDDLTLRARYFSSLSTANAATPDAIRTAVLGVEDVVAVIVKENTTFTPDADGLPGKSFRAVVDGGADDLIAQTIWDTKPAGIASDGTYSIEVTDGYGNNHYINFNRPVIQYATVEVDYSVDPEGIFPEGGEDAIHDAVVQYGKSLTMGSNLHPQKIMSTIYKNVGGVEDLVIRVGVSLTDATLPTGSLTTAIIQVASEDLVNISVARNTVQELV